MTADLTATELLAAYRSGELSPVEATDLGMDDPSLDDHGKPVQGKPEVVQRAKEQGKAGLDLCSAVAQVHDRQRLVYGYFSGHLSRYDDPLGVALPVAHR